MTTLNPHGELACLRKAIRLADALDVIGYTDLTVVHISSAQMAVASSLASVPQASSATWEVVYELLKQRRQYRLALPRQKSRRADQDA